MENIKTIEYFFPKNAEKKEESFELEASKRFKDEDGNIIKWKFRLLSAKEIDDITKSGVKTKM